MFWTAAIKYSWISTLHNPLHRARSNPYAPGADFRYDLLLKEIMKEVIPSLKKKLANYQK
jgi:hypothetical protein